MGELKANQDGTWVKRLLEWYQGNKRSLPWRSSPSPYRVWVSEIMLQQTQVDTVIPYFNRFIDRFPGVEELAAADIEAVLKLWEGLGYYARVRNLHKAARMVCEQHNSVIPASFTELKRLPGLGEYTAAAVASIAFGERVPAVDGNCLRVFARLWGVKETIDQSKVKNLIRDRLAEYVPARNPSGFNQSIMELGALICRPANPNCGQCPIQSDCIAYEKGLTTILPIRKRKSVIPHRHLVAGVVWREGKVLVTRRGYDEMLGGLWRFPTGTISPGDDAAAKLEKALKDQANLSANVTREYGEISHGYTHFKITVTVLRCELAEAEPVELELNGNSDNIDWIGLEDVEKYPFDKASLKIIDLVRSVDSVL